MKKSIKYAGIAAATLLAVAPVAAPVVSQAAVDTTVTTDQSAQTAAADAFNGQFADQKAKALSTAKVQLGTEDLTADDFYTNNAGLVNGTALTTDQIAKLNAKSQATVTVSAKYGSTAIKTTADLVKVLKDATYPEVDLTITLNYVDYNGKAQSRTATVKATRETTVDQMTSAKATFTTPITVPLNSTTTSTTLDASNDATIKDQNGDSVLTTSDNVAADSNFYNTYTDAMNAAAGQTVTASTGVGTDSSINGGATSFLKAGTYYQVINFSAASSSNLAKFIANYNADPATYTVYVNGKKASAGYDFVASGDTLSFVRTINVSNSTENWTVSSVSGVVTTKDGSSYYTLKNDDNVTVKNRALAANTAWKADKVRTDQDGNKQYRVATGEWIDANDVTFGDSATDNNNNSASGLTDIQSVKGVVSVGTPGFTYLLYSKDGKLIKNRALAGGTDWAFINTAKDSDGTTYYRVATDEWVAAGNGVTVK